MKKIIPVLVLAFAVTASGKEAEKKPAADAKATAEYAELVVTTLEKTMDVIAANKDDCVKMGGALGKFFDDHNADLAKIKEGRKNITEEQKKELQKKYGARMQAAFAKGQDGIYKCRDSAEVKAALAKMPR